MKPSLGIFDTGAAARIDIDRLIESRMLLQAGDDGGAVTEPIRGQVRASEDLF